MSAGVSQDLNEEDVPSRRCELLKLIEGARIVRLVRFSLDPPDEATRDLGVPESEVFSRTSGPLLLWLESGAVIGASSQPSLISVTLWLEQAAGGAPGDIQGDDELYAVDAADPRYSDEHIGRLVGRRVRAVHVIVREARDAR